MSRRSEFAKSKRIVVKIGSALLTDGGKGLNQEAIAVWVAQMAQLKQQGIEVVLVSSGSVAEGMSRLGLTARPKALHELQAAASVGQMGLVQNFESNFQAHGVHTAQVLLTHDDLSDRKRYLNARSTLLALLNYSVVPVINENDAVATDEIRFGDNDTLAALVANLVEADLLIILTDQLGLFDSDPSVNASAVLIEQISSNDERLEAMAGGSRSGLGRGGMATKVSAARLASRSGASTVIASGDIGNVLTKVIAGEQVGTYLYANIEPIVARKQWLAGQLQAKGRLVLDAGAVNVLRKSGKSLLAVGIKTVEGYFNRGELVVCLDSAGVEVARGLVNYKSAEVALIKGCASSQFENILGYADDEEVIHRDNLVLV
ncbi:glutamate 5-kinase [Bathymodiolus japonicus methanotrophic gill symbiont]|uniref:glutamate 5-kinase n=1 Tax=Bathymodiolus japonicus methanotrophic gill symbiont TaxID=113269 RepID=UPI001B49EAB2|nr:glutamate 5-kinase [Bathymodiolus japonicus methanotrophic gill symbiont]GFO71791.1 glutamate 5-kinase [Bathymodiolus japonicus methanotrophic gill symbiont]